MPGRHKDNQTDRKAQKGRHTYRQTNIKTDRQTGQQITYASLGYRQTGKRSEILQILDAKTGQMIVLKLVN